MKNVRFWLTSILLAIALSAVASTDRHGLVFAQHQSSGKTNTVGGVFICDCTASVKECVCITANEN